MFFQVNKPTSFGVEDALQGFGGFSNQPKGRHMKKVFATFIASAFAATVFAATPTPAPTVPAAAPQVVKTAVTEKKHKMSKVSKKKIAPTAQTPSTAAVK